MTPPVDAKLASVSKDWIDRARGICIILVVMMHTALGVEKVLGQTGMLHAVVAWTKPFRMPDFFLLSGYLAGGIGALTWRAFVDRRILHYMYFYVVWLAILVSIKLLVDGLFSVESMARAFALGLIEPFASLWFIYVLPVFLILARCAKGRNAGILYAFAVTLHIWAAFYPEGGVYAMSSQATGWIAPDSIALFMVFFLSGYYGRSWIDQIAPAVRRAPAPSIVFLLIWAILHSYAFHEGLAAIPGLTLVFGLSGAVAIVVLAVLVERAPSLEWLAYCGRHSLSIYLAFVIPMAAVRGLMVGKFGVNQADVVMITVLVCAIVFPLALERISRRTPVRFLFNRPDWTQLKGSKAHP